MDAYTDFAEVYEKFMDNIPYSKWAEYLTSLLKEYGVTDGLVCELGCGTGIMTRILRNYGYDMIGIDNSYEMLDIAREHEYLLEENETGEKQLSSILYLLQDMREFELYGTVAAVVSVCDSINYITDYNDLIKVFRLVNNYLDKDGIFIFDLKTEHYYHDILGDTTIAENREDCSFIWVNSYFEKERLNQYELTIYKREYNNDNSKEEHYVKNNELYTRSSEIHTQKAYKLYEIISALEEAGMIFVTAYDAFTRQPVTETSERIYIIAKEKYQENKKY